MNIKIELLEKNKGQIPGVPKNPRKQSKAKFEALKKSIIDLPEMLELRELLVYPCGGKYVIIGGNMRFRALSALGYKTAPCKVLPPETPPEKLKAIVLQDNNSFGEDDFAKLLDGWSLDELNSLGYDVPDYLKGGDAGETQDSEEPPASDDDSTGAPKKAAKRKSWHNGERKEEARCDLKPRPGIIMRTPYLVVHSFARSEEGVPLSELKEEKNVSVFISAACTALRGLLGMASPRNYALVTAPPRRHKGWNFAEAIAEGVSRVLGVHYYPGAFEALNRNRIDPKLELKTKIAEDNLIIYDDILTTGSTLRSLAAFFPDKNVTLICGVNNN